MLLQTKGYYRLCYLPPKFYVWNNAFINRLHDYQNYVLPQIILTSFFFVNQCQFIKTTPSNLSLKSHWPKTVRFCYYMVTSRQHEYIVSISIRIHREGESACRLLTTQSFFPPVSTNLSSDGQRPLLVSNQSCSVATIRVCHPLCFFCYC